ncbi:SGNH/GDSL hydrolase family protein [Acidobacterium sp. S8]|uniref:SGNH/GDSL hydrolase family protein n=1 Tax=Acidobacterium sp. S8 TaxID=1641854 RepID=UPI00131CC7D7|nr:SGNH/GDSL hydrolase family protein [Acidobacterium sp. S8]
MMIRHVSFARGIGTTSALAAILLCSPGLLSLHAQKAKSIPEEIEWTWEVRPPHPDSKLPNVLLLGDSITRAYFPQVTKDLDGTANVYLMASSTSVGDPRLPNQIAEFAKMEGLSFRIVHFNNGMHGWAYTEDQYKASFPSFLRAVKKLAGSTQAMIWATTTPVRNDATGGASNARVDARNDIADSLVKAAGIVIDDQYALMMQHQDLHQDSVHFQPAGAALQGDQAAASIKTALTRLK